MAVWALRKDGAVLWMAKSGLYSHHTSVPVLVPITYGQRPHPGLDWSESSELVFIYAGTMEPVAAVTIDQYKQLCAQASIVGTQ